MKLSKAKSLLQIDHTELSQSELQTYKVRLLDAWRYARGDYGVNNDFFIPVPELKSVVPADKWLLRNIETRLDELGL